MAPTTRGRAKAAQQPAETPKVAISDAGRRVYTLFVPGIPPNLNARLHYMARYRSNEAFKAAVAWQVKGLYPSVLGQARVTCTLTKPRGKLYDPDGAYGCVKPILDGLVICGLLVDDSPAHIDLLVTQERGPVRGVRITVEEVEGLG